jgi:hypothetical protein
MNIINIRGVLYFHLFTIINGLLRKNGAIKVCILRINSETEDSLLIYNYHMKC